MKIIGLCGGSGSGKGVVSSLFLEYNIPSIDTDAVYRELTSGESECLKALSLEFGNEIIADDGALNRKKLASVVFSGDNSSIKLKKLNEITHRFILDEARRRLLQYERQGCCAAIVDAPVLFESGFDDECDFTVCVVADRETRISRIIQRDGISRVAAEQRINSQIPDSELVSKCDYAVYNNSGPDALRPQIERIVELIKK